MPIARLYWYFQIDNQRRLNNQCNKRIDHSLDLPRPWSDFSLRTYCNSFSSGSAKSEHATVCKVIVTKPWSGVIPHVPITNPGRVSKSIGSHACEPSGNVAAQNEWKIRYKLKVLMKMPIVWRYTSKYHTFHNKHKFDDFSKLSCSSRLWYNILLYKY